MYDTPEESADAAPEAETETETAPPAEEKPEGKTALINADVCPGMEVGDEMVLKVVGVHDGEYEVKYLPEPKEEAEEKGDMMGSRGGDGMYE